MREHQIIITLKPDQFLQVQRLARVAGAKSMGMFVRQRLLAALGIEGEMERDGRGSVDLQPAVSELKRLHSELRGFVAESLAMYLDGDVSDSTGVGTDPDLMFGASNPSVEQRSTETAATLPGAETYDRPVDVDVPLVGFPDEFDQHDDTASIEAPPQVVPETLPDVVPAESMRDDELEKLADRTFAISPRLGAIEPVTPPLQAVVGPSSGAGTTLRDPLGELLEGADLSDDEPDFVEEEESFTIPLAIQERRRQIAQAEQHQVEETSTTNKIEDGTTEKIEMQPTIVRPARVSLPEQTLRNDAPEEESAGSDQAQSQSGTESKSNAPAKGAPDAGSLGNRGGNPISGGPPPKRRKS